MEKLKFETPDMVAGSIEKIGALFPAAITEMRGEDGQIKKGINFEVLKKAAMAEAARPITKTLRPVKEDSRDWDTTQNLYIEGDNLEVLKILQESYLGKVKMIYIDPPYNTGHDFIYRDRFQRSQQEENDKWECTMKRKTRCLRTQKVMAGSIRIGVRIFTAPSFFQRICYHRTVLSLYRSMITNMKTSRESAMIHLARVITLQL